MTSFPKIKSVSPLENQRLRVKFSTGTQKIYDCTTLLDAPPFTPLKNKGFFKQVHVDQNGFGVVWNDDIDLSESELWLHGTEVLP